MAKLAWTPWHKVVQLREDLKSGELSLAIFAADLYDVVMGKARSVYQDPQEFFALTYPTFNLRELARDVVTRLAGKHDKAIRQLELTYGGGKTHTLITLFHLVRDPAHLPHLPSVAEFTEHIGMTPPQTRVAVLAFDKLDVEKGMEIREPAGTTRWLKNPWSVLAFQIAGADGLRLLHAEGKAEERDSAPAENLLTELLALPGKQNLATLILIDEVLMYAREKVGLDPTWRGRLINFFQYLTQAATKVDRCAIVASLLATDPMKSDTLGKEITQELYAIFRREKEESVQPVLKEDVAEVLRRRFFTPDSIRDHAAFRPRVIEALQGIYELDEQTNKDKKTAEERLLQSYPFHPDLTEIFYTKWTNLESFQRTRGILRTFALALRDAESWDTCPLVATNVFLGTPGRSALSESARELTNVAETEEYEGKKQEWSGILEGELAKARDVQTELAGLKFREVEQAVFATFLHSQPIGKDAHTRELMVLLGHTRPDKIELEKALHRWTEISWFLDENALQDLEPGTGGAKQLPKSWRLGSRPNLHQMHHDACTRVSRDFVEDKLNKEISACKSLTANALASGARVHSLPNSPRDIDDDGEFRYAILGPKFASSPGRPGTEARRFVDEYTGPDRPRVYRNAVMLVVPSIDGLEASRNSIREYLGWLEVEEQLKGQDLDPNRKHLLDMAKADTARRITELVRQAYCIVVTVSEKNEVQAFKVVVTNDPLFNIIKNDPQSRIQETAVSADALLPGGPYDLWREGETARRLKDLVGAFAQFSQLPKMLNRKAILDTLLDGCRNGLFVLRLPRPDHTFKTFWHEEPDETVIGDPGLEVVLSQSAKLSELPSKLLSPGALPELWHNAELPLRDLYSYFSGHVVTFTREGYEYEEEIAIPGADRDIVNAATQAAVKEKRLCLISGHASFLAEDIPAGILTDDAYLQTPPQPIPVKDILPDTLSEAWSDGTTTALAIYEALCTKMGKILPWLIVQEAIDGAIRARQIERTVDSRPWPCDYAGAKFVKIQLLVQEQSQQLPPFGPPPKPRPGMLVAEASLETYEIQNLSEQISDLTRAAIGLDLKFLLRVELGSNPPPPEEAVAKINQLLHEVSEQLMLKPS